MLLVLSPEQLDSHVKGRIELEAEQGSQGRQGLSAPPPNTPPHWRRFWRLVAVLAAILRTFPGLFCVSWPQEVADNSYGVS